MGQNTRLIRIVCYEAVAPMGQNTRLTCIVYCKAAAPAVAGKAPIFLFNFKKSQ
jgi:hypothetical protein